MTNAIDIRNKLATVQVWLLVAVAATIPTRLTIVNSICILALIAVWLVGIILAGKVHLSEWKHFFILSSFFFVSLFSILYSSNLPPILSKLETRLSLAAFPMLFVVSEWRGRKMMEQVLWAFVAVCLLSAVVCTIDTFYRNYSNGIAYEAATSWNFSADNLVDRLGFHPSYFSIYCDFSIFILIYFYKQKKIGAVAMSAIIVFFIAFIFLLASRVGILAFVVVACLTILYEAYVHKKLMMGFGILAGFFVVCVIIGMNVFIVREKFNAMLNLNVNVYNEPFKMSKRWIQWESAVEIYKSSPLLGVGVGDLQDELDAIYARRNFQEGIEYGYNPHNLLLDTAAALGIVGVISVIVLFISCFRRAIRYKSLLYFQFLSLFLLISMVESSLSVQKGIIFFALFNTMFYVLLGRGLDPSSETDPVKS